MDDTFTVPNAQTAILQQEGGVLKTTPNQPIPEFNPGQMLVKTHAVALNPCDWKMPLRFPTEGLWDGCDFSGTVVALGSQAAQAGRFRLGDRVFGAVQGSNQTDPQSGAYCEYIRVFPDFTFHIPDDMSFTTAPAISGTGIATLGVALFWSLQLQGTLDKPITKPEDVFVYGGSSTIGLIAIQILKLCGYRVITTCSSRNFDLVRSYGADLMFDYKSPTCAEDIRAATKNHLRYVLDPFADMKAVRLCQEIIGRTGGRYCALEEYQEDLLTRKVIKHELVMGGAISGNGVELPEPYGSPARPEIGEWARPWYRSIQELIMTAKIRPTPIEIIPGRFDGILNGLEMLKHGSVSGKKLVVSMEASD
ncbi:Polyketide synthase enoylreductase [Penicillium angulare]|uniref:Polyketide synthase enoylreductase n=1 Tax=Penicillium angulare TaxID=116970 RepID=UPI0025424A23|nr:Polyketide synthase enoylreductase [Penicillium angulare]KAJ5287936.1 Polyketide synthase enoylreductase [Penicillium angulare]